MSSGPDVSHLYDPPKQSLIKRLYSLTDDSASTYDQVKTLQALLFVVNTGHKFHDDEASDVFHALAKIMYNKNINIEVVMLSLMILRKVVGQVEEAFFLATTLDTIRKKWPAASPLALRLLQQIAEPDKRTLDTYAASAASKNRQESESSCLVLARIATGQTLTSVGSIRMDKELQTMLNKLSKKWSVAPAHLLRALTTGKERDVAGLIRLLNTAIPKASDLQQTSKQIAQSPFLVIEATKIAGKAIRTNKCAPSSPLVSMLTSVASCPAPRAFGSGFSRYTSAAVKFEAMRQLVGIGSAYNDMAVPAVMSSLDILDGTAAARFVLASFIKCIGKMPQYALTVANTAQKLLTDSHPQTVAWGFGALLESGAANEDAMKIVTEVLHSQELLGRAKSLPDGLKMKLLQAAQDLAEGGSDGCVKAYDIVCSLLESCEAQKPRLAAAESLLKIAELSPELAPRCAEKLHTLGVGGETSHVFAQIAYALPNPRPVLVELVTGSFIGTGADKVAAADALGSLTGPGKLENYVSAIGNIAQSLDNAGERELAMLASPQRITGDNIDIEKIFELLPELLENPPEYTESINLPVLSQTERLVPDENSEEETTPTPSKLMSSSSDKPRSPLAGPEALELPPLDFLPPDARFFCKPDREFLDVDEDGEALDEINTTFRRWVSRQGILLEFTILHKLEDTVLDNVTFGIDVTAISNDPSAIPKARVVRTTVLDHLKEEEEGLIYTYIETSPMAKPDHLTLVLQFSRDGEDEEFMLGETDIGGPDFVFPDGVLPMSDDSGSKAGSSSRGSPMKYSDSSAFDMENMPSTKVAFESLKKELRLPVIAYDETSTLIKATMGGTHILGGRFKMECSIKGMQSKSSRSNGVSLSLSISATSSELGKLVQSFLG